MINLTPPLSVLTPNAAANELRAHGLDALGLTVPTLSTVWAANAPNSNDYSSTELTLTVDNIRAPFRGILSIAETASLWSDVDGRALTGPLAVLRLHPEAARRLESIAAARYGDPLILPIPVAMVIRDITPPDATAVNWYLAGESLGFAGNSTLSFHDSRGLIIDPIAVAALFNDLLTWQPALSMTQDAGATGAVADIAGLASGVLCHVIDPHGWGYRAIRDAATLKLVDEDGEQQSILEESLFDWAESDRIGRANDDDPVPPTDDKEPPPPPPPLQWGWATNGTLSRQLLSQPSLPEGVTLNRQFLRVIAVDLDWHLIGNRSPDQIDSGDTTIPGDDDRIPDYALPQVRQAVPNFEYLVDGMAVLSAANGMTIGFPSDDSGEFALAVSPEIDPTLAVPPGASLSAAPLANVDPTQNLLAQWQTGSARDVILMLSADAVPAGTHVRVFPRQFVTIRTIGEQPSFVRGDGGAAIAEAGEPTIIRLVNPFALEEGSPVPDPAYLSVDVVLVNAGGQRRLFSSVAVTVAESTEWTDNLSDFGGQAILAEGSAVGSLLPTAHSRAIAPTPLFGIPNSLPPAQENPNLSGIGQLVRRLASESQPRQGPRLPTQARFETILAVGVDTGPKTQLRWNALLTGARWAWESRSARPELGNPGNPAGPDIHATGVRCDGQLAYDLAFHALKRSQSIFPLAKDAFGWFATSGGDNWDAPDLDPSGTVSAAMLETVAPFCDSPELSTLGIPQPGTTAQSTVNNITTAISNAFSPSLPLTPPGVDVYNEEEMLPRLQREIATAKYGQRDALWSLRRALGQAREYIYIESPTFARTAYPIAEALPHEIDLVNVIAERLSENPRLKVIICLPRHPDFAPERDNWALAAINHRTEALNALLAAVPTNRVAAFHPIGFPGRSTAIRSTTVIVDDIWCMVGTSHMRRRGMTFDGGVDVVSFDREMVNGYSNRIARFRQSLMAAKLGVVAPTAQSNDLALWVRLAHPESAFDAIADLLKQGGLGRLSPIWAGPTAIEDLEETDLDLADPNGVDDTGTNLFNLLIGQLLEGD